MNTYQQKQLLEDIYDLVKECALSRKQVDSYATMSRIFATTARHNLRSFLRKKSIEWNGDTNTIKIGEHILIKLEKI